MGASVAAPVSRRAAPGPAAAARGAASARPLTPNVAGVPTFLSTVQRRGAAASSVASRIDQAQQRVQTEDRDQAELLADRIGQPGVRDAMRTQDTREAARQAQAASSAATSGPDAAPGLAATSPMSTMAATPLSSIPTLSSSPSTSTGQPADAGMQQPAPAEMAFAAGVVGGDVPTGAASADGATGKATSADEAATGAAPGTAAPGTGGAAAGADPSNGIAGGRSVSGSQSAEPARLQADAPTPATGAGDLDSGDLGLIDFELAEHQRWAAASGRVGEVASIERAEFIAESVGGGFIDGVATGAAMGLGIGVVTRAVPLIGPIIGGSMALHGLLTRDWAATGETIGRFGEGSDSYETLANSLASVSAVIDVVSGILGVINGIVGVVQVVAIGVAAGAGVLAFFTFGATAGIAIAAGELAVTCEEISEAINIVTMVLDGVNAALLNPCITLFRALHAFTTQADPREVETSGQALSAAASASGSALGGWIGGRAAHAGARPRPAHDDGAPATTRPPHEAPPPAPGEGPEVHFQPAPTEGATHAGAAPEVPTSTRPSVEEIAASPGLRATDEAVAPAASAPATSAPATSASAGAAPAAPLPASSAGPQQLELPGVPLRPTREPRGPQPPDEIAPPDAHSAYLRRLRAEAGGGPVSTEPGSGPYNVARHHVPGDNTARPRTPAPDLYQASPRTPGEQSHHLEQQTPLARAIEGYSGKEDVTVNMPRSEHESLRAPQARQEANMPAFERALGRPAAIAESANIASHGQRAAVPPGQAPIMVPEAVAGQTAMEHAGYLFTRSPLRRPDLPVRSPAHGNDRTPRPLASETLATPARTARGPHMGEADIDWGRTFNQPDPHNLAAPPGTQLDLPNMVHPAPRPASTAVQEQLSLPGMDRPGPNPNQTSLPFDTPTARGATRTSPDTPQRVGEGSTRSSEALTQAQYEQNAAMAVEMGMPADQIHRAQGDTSYHPGYDALLIGPDVNPLPASQRPTGLANPANAALEPRAVIGHEVIGHREPALAGQTRDEVWHEELQASARAALHTPELSHEQSWLLLQDAAARRRFQTREGEIYVDTERYGPAAQTRAPGPAAPGSHPGEPSVVVDWNAVGAPPSAAPVSAPATTSAAPAVPASPTAASASAASRSPSAPLATPATPSTAASGAGVTSTAARAARDVIAGGDAAQPAAGVERVATQYTPPPATPAQIVAVQNEILNLLAVRARAEREVEHQDQRVAASQANRAPIDRTMADTRAGLSAIAAHEAAVARRDAANQEQQRRQQETAGLTAGYPSRATGLTALAVPLTAWEGFTSLASHLPGDAGDRMAEMNQQTREMQAAFDQMGARMLGVDGEQPAREGELAGAAVRLDATGEQAQASDQRLQKADEGAGGLRDANEATLAQAQRRSEAASGRSQSLADAAREREQQAATLAAQLQAWAVLHHDQRTGAVDRTVRRLEAEGKVVTPAAAE